MHEIIQYAAIGFAAQIIDGTLGMAYGVSASSLLLAQGMAPVVVSSTVHAAEVFTTGISGMAHRYFGNVEQGMFWKLMLPGVIGAVTGAFVLGNVMGDVLKPLIAAYLGIMGILIMTRVFKTHAPRTKATRLVPLGFMGALMDAIGGGGWGPIVTSTLVARGHHARLTIGTVNAVEFFVTLAASITFIFTIGLQHWRIIAGLGVGGIVAAPLGAYFCTKIPHRPFMFAVGLLVLVISLRTLIKAW